MALDDSVRLYHTVYKKSEGEDLVEKSLRICENGLNIVSYNTDDIRTKFLFFNDSPQDRQNPVIIVEVPKKRVHIADRTDKSGLWSSSITRYEDWKKNNSKVPYPEYLIPSTVPVEQILGVLYDWKEYSRTDFIKEFKCDGEK